VSQSGKRLIEKSALQALLGPIFGRGETDKCCKKFENWLALGKNRPWKAFRSA
jgi:hypothetical protein